ncbi:MAG: ATP-binding protein [Gammaproteobacteria bacterium]|nr:ATP-binding protein [Gammaproteobacteria bacterium]NNK98937.1 ATP-binding protein [Xanthomonadales bacterium]
MRQKFKRSFNELKNIVTMTETVFREQGLEPSLRNVVDLATEELFVNMVTYNTESSEDILIEMKPHAVGLEVSLTDYDVERFDPTRAANVDVDAPLNERAAGGLGLYLVLKMVDSIHYEYRNRQSKITFIVDRK